MAYTLWSQDIFSKGELSPYMYARVTVNEYNNGLKTAQNVLTYPSGAAGKRFGTLYLATIPTITSANQLYFNTFQYLNECVYQIIILPGFIYIYLEGGLIEGITNTLNASQIQQISNTVLSNAFRIAGPGFKPLDLTRYNNITSNIVSFTTNAITASANLWNNSGLVSPVKFEATGGTIIQTTPQILTGVTYFAAGTSLNTALLFKNSKEAKDYLVTGNTNNAFVINSLGTGTTHIHVYNGFQLNEAKFKNLPVYDFNGLITSYDNCTFTPAAKTGSNVTITVSPGYSLLDSSYIGGAFFGSGGTARITNVISNTSFKVSIQTPFDSTDPIQGSLVLLAEPAWSNKRGWPQVCSSYQNRALFANTNSLPNGFYASVINDYSDFGDLTQDDDDAISWYPTSDNMNFIKYIVPYRSITVHTNTGIYSSPLSDVTAITPSNFTLQLQDSTPADVLQPVAIDNQIIVLSGNDAHKMLWDGINNAYTSSIVSIVNEQTIRNPVDETAFVDLRRAGSRFVFIINENGSMAAFQTLLSENVSGFTPQILEQSYGNAKFIQAASSADGRCWFVCERQIAKNNSPISITGFTPKSLNQNSTLQALGIGLLGDIPTPLTFTTTQNLPSSIPQIKTNQYYWGVGIDGDNFYVYLTQNDALNNVNAINFTNAGTLSNVIAWPLETIFTLEELTKDVFLDCAIQYNGAPTNTIDTGILFNAQNVKMIGNGFGFDSPAEKNINNSITFESHGSNQNITNAYIGFPINTIIEPMPLAISSGSSAKSSTLTIPKHIRYVRFMFNNTIGGTINGIPISILPFNESNIGQPPNPATGIFEMSVFKAWDDFNNPTYTIFHDEPFDIQLLGVFYSLEI